MTDTTRFTRWFGAALIGLVTVSGTASAQGRTAPKAPPPPPQPRPNPVVTPTIGVVSPPAYVYRPSPTIITPGYYTPPAILTNPWTGPTFIPSTYQPPLAISKDPGQYVTFPSGIKVNPVTRTTYNPYTDTFVRPNGATYSRDFWTGTYTNPLTGGVYDPVSGIRVRPAVTVGLNQGPASPWATNPFPVTPWVNPNPFLNVNPVVGPNPFLNPVGVQPAVGFVNPLAGNNVGPFGPNQVVQLPQAAPLVRPFGAFGPLPGLQ